MEFKLEVFSERLKDLRLERNLTTVELAKEINASDSAITRWEKGQRTPTAYNLYNIAKFFNVSADYLLGLTDYE